MVVVEQSTVIAAPVKAVMEAVNDVASFPAWATVKGVIYNVQGSGVGKTFEWHYSVEGINFLGKSQIIEQTENTVITKTSGDVDSLWTVTLTPISPKSTAIRVVVEYNPPHRFVEALADQVIQRYATPAVASENLRRFKEMVEERVKITEENL
ncbi:MAG: SRPBCC family protein [Anaerolineae bacterium]|nr:SRPBCC family protein [Anaerolineae bacterium]